MEGVQLFFVYGVCGFESMTYIHKRTHTTHTIAYLASNDDIDGTFQDDIPAVTLVPLVEHYSKRGRVTRSTSRYNKLLVCVQYQRCYTPQVSN